MLDAWIAGLSDGTTLWLVLLVAVLLGLRHATDPDHLAAVTTLVAGGRVRIARRAGELGLAWGMGHATTLFVFGLPILLLNRYLPMRVEQAAETAIGIVIVYLALRLIVRWRRGVFHPHGADTHVHVPSRTRLGAFGIGLVHGMGGSGGVAVLVLASVRSTALAVLALVLLAVFTAVSMCLVSTGFGRALVSAPMRGAIGTVAPGLGALSLAFGIWYATAAWSLVPYVF
jgi:high-affinity nickel permease